MFYHGDISFNSEVYITNVRHKTALQNALQSLNNVIQSIDFDMKNNNLKLDDDDSIVSNFYLEKFFHKRLPAAVLDFGEDIQVITFREMRDVLYQDLNKLTRAFEIYLCEYVGKIESVKISKEIKSLGIDHVLSFNYSHTYQKLYDKPKKIKYDYKGEVCNEYKRNGIEKNIGRIYTNTIFGGGIFCWK